MAKSTTEGICNYCKNRFSKLSMKKHIEKCCEMKDAIAKSQDYFIVFVQGYYEKEYWLYLSVSNQATLKNIDSFLRDIWLECCGHLSSFDINREVYESSPEYGEGKSMNSKVNKIFYEGLEFKHEYDSGSTTTLKLKVVSSYTGSNRKEKVELMARNVAPEIKCSNCGKDAAFICCECACEGGGEGMLCEICREEHECDEEMFLPIVNSPRVGVCGYEG